MNLKTDQLKLYNPKEKEKKNGRKIKRFRNLWDKKTTREKERGRAKTSPNVVKKLTFISKKYNESQYEKHKDTTPRNLQYSNCLKSKVK